MTGLVYLLHSLDKIEIVIVNQILMVLKLTAHIEPVSNSQFVAWIENEKFKGTVVQASTLGEAWKELMISIKVKIAYDYNIQINSISEQKVESMEEFSYLMAKAGKNDINLVLH